MTSANEPRRILQLEGRVTADAIERAYAASRTRYLCLTARDPLHYYRRRLLNDVETAYRRLRTPLVAAKRSGDGLVAAKPSGRAEAARAIPARKSILQQQVAKQPSVDFRTPLRSAITEKNLLASRPLTVTARTVAGRRDVASRCTSGSRPCSARSLSKRDQALIEDDFCREVFYRLEGDLLRYSSRRELLALAQQSGVHLFRANFLMAQIVECVRQSRSQKSGVRNQEFESSSQEKKMNESFLNWRRVMLWAGLIGLVLLLYLDALLLEAFYRGQ